MDWGLGEHPAPNAEPQGVTKGVDATGVKSSGRMLCRSILLQTSRPPDPKQAPTDC